MFACSNSWIRTDSIFDAMNGGGGGGGFMVWKGFWFKQQVTVNCTGKT